jgi:apolipoprotein N-acyltransferase
MRSFGIRLLLAVLAGIVYALAYPPLGWRWLVLPGLAGLLITLQGQHGTRARALGFLHGMAVYSLGLSWLYEIFGTLVVVLWFVLAAFHALFAEMQSRAVARGMEGWKLVLFTVINWCGWEFIRAELFPLRFPWMTPGLAIGPNRLLPWIGVYGVGALVLLLVVLLVSRRWKLALLPAAVLGAAIAMVSREPAPEAADPMSVKVAGVQMEGVSLTEFIKATEKLPPDVRYVVWPEYAVPYDIRLNARDWKLVRELCEKRNITLTFGTKLDLGPGEGWSNIALTIDPDGTRGEHRKVHTVHFFDDGKPGKTALPVPTRHGDVGTPVCFDCDYERVTRKMSAAGAEMFIVPIMDAESWTARQHDQHAELFRIRACENGRWMFVCGTSGVSQIIDPQGQLHGRMAALEQGILTGMIKRESALTFYTRFGNGLPWCLLGLAAGVWLLLVVPAAWLRESIFRVKGLGGALP